MKEYSAKEIKKLKENPYTYSVSKNRIYFTIEFKEAFWNGYQAGITPRQLLSDLGYDLSLFGQNQIDGMVQGIKKQALSPEGFREGTGRRKLRNGYVSAEKEAQTKEGIVSDKIWNEVKYLRQEVEFIKKILNPGKAKKKK